MLVNRANSPRRFLMLLVATVAGLGLLLAALGIYGVISYSVTWKTQEIGVRMGLGATAGRVRRNAILNTVHLAMVGIAAGTNRTGGVSPPHRSASLRYFPLGRHHLCVDGAVARPDGIASGYIPGRRASCIDLMIALRSR